VDTDSELDRLRAEHAAEVVGPVIYARVELVIGRLVANRDPVVYTGGLTDAGARADLVQAFFQDVLLGEDQLVYVFGVAGTIGDFERLIQWQARRYVAKQRRHTVVDNLLKRSVDLLRAAEDVEAIREGDRELFRLRNPAQPGIPGEEDRLRRAIALAAAVPKIAGRGDERAPKIYSTETLGKVLRILLETYVDPVGRSELDIFFSTILTSWKPTILGLDEEQDERADEALTPEEEMLATTMATTLAESMTPEEKTIFQLKYSNVADREVADHLNMSRQSLAPRKQRLFERISEDIGSLSSYVQVAILKRLAATIIDAEAQA
jgi:hypothetical protein